MRLYLESLGLVYWDDPEGWYREGGGRGVQDGEHMYTRGGFMLLYGSGNSNRMTLRDVMEREVGGGFRMGNTCTPMADSCHCMAKTTTIL